ncbi:hypothetical protein [Flavobacterium sp.]|uniref:hypothetical protein n=1 Tax=Flavobacterium sp. TaxID=239 RepID=UPI00391A624F
MKTITETELLKEHIIHLKLKQAIELRQLKSEVHSAIHHLNPLASFFGSADTSETKFDLVDTAVSLTSQLLFKNNILSRFQEPIKRWLGNWLQNFIK